MIPSQLEDNILRFQNIASKKEKKIGLENQSEKK